MKIFMKVIFFLTLSLGVPTLLIEADEDSPCRETFITSNSITFLDDIANKAATIKLEEEQTTFTFNNQTIFISEYDKNLMAQIVYLESRGEPYEGKVAVASVILNRVLNPKFPNSVYEVVFQPNAFSCILNGQINASPTIDCYQAVYDALNGIDPTNKALFFYNPTIATCSWMKNSTKSDIIQIGQHVFFKIN